MIPRTCHRCGADVRQGRCFGCGADPLTDSLRALEDAATVADLAPYGPAHQRARYEYVRSFAAQAQAALECGLSGDCHLVGAVLEAHRLLGQAVAEIMAKKIDEPA